MPNENINSITISSYNLVDTISISENGVFEYDDISIIGIAFNYLFSTAIYINFEEIERINHIKQEDICSIILHGEIASSSLDYPVTIIDLSNGESSQETLIEGPLDIEIGIDNDESGLLIIPNTNEQGNNSICVNQVIINFINDIDRIEIINNPNKLSYYVGEPFDPTGMVIKAYYTNGLEEDVTSLVTFNRTINQYTEFIDFYYREYNHVVSTRLSIQVINQYGELGDNLSSSYILDNPRIRLSNLTYNYYEEGLSIGNGKEILNLGFVYNLNTPTLINNKSVGLPINWKLTSLRLIFLDGEDEGHPFYKYIDELGDIHIFEEYQNRTYSYTYFDKEGKGLKLTKNTNDFKIVNIDGDELTFSLDGYIISEKSGSDENNIVYYVYENNKLIRIYNSLNENRKIEIEYSDSGLINKIKTKEYNNIKEEILVNYNENNQIINFIKRKNNNDLLLSSFDYENNNIIRFTNEINKKTTIFNNHINHNESRLIITEGYYKNNVFSEIERYVVSKTYLLNNSIYNSGVVIRNKLGISYTYLLDSDNRLIDKVEFINNNSIKTLYRINTLLDPFSEGTSNKLINNKRSYVLNSNYIYFNNLSLNEYKNFVLSLMLYHDYEGLNKIYIEVSYRDQNENYYKYQEIDKKLINIWQTLQISLSFKEDSSLITNIRIRVVMFDENNNPNFINENVEINAFNLKANDISNLIINGYSFEKYTKVKIKTEVRDDILFDFRKGYYKYLDDPSNLIYNDYKFTKEDFIKTLESRFRFDLTNEFYFDNGKKRLPNYFSLEFYRSDDTNLTDGISIEELRNEDEYNIKWYIREKVSNNLIKTRYATYYLQDRYLILKQIKRGEDIETITDEIPYKIVEDSSTVEKNEFNGYVISIFNDNKEVKEKKLINSDETKSITIYKATFDEDNRIIREDQLFDSESYTYSDNNIHTIIKNELRHESYYPTNNILEYNYDNNSRNISEIKYKNGSQIDKTIDLDYEDDDLNYIGKPALFYSIEQSDDKLNTTISINNNLIEEINEDREFNNETIYKYYNDDNQYEEIKLQYDNYNKLTNVCLNGVNKVTYSYEEGDFSETNKNVIRIDDEFSNRTYNFTYDEASSLKEVSFEDCIIKNIDEEEFEYIINNHSIHKIYTKEGEYLLENYYKENEDNEIKLDLLSYTYTYDDFGRLLSKEASEIDENNPQNNLSLKFRYGYSDSHLDVISERHTLNNEDILYNQYEYDSQGRISTIFDNQIEVTISFSYDTFGRLLSESYEGYNFYDTRNYTYDNNGNIINFNGKLCSYDSLNRLIRFNNTIYSYDNYGNRLSKDSIQYTWTRGKLLSSIGTNTFEYDYKGIRTKKNTIKYYYNDDKIIGELRVNNLIQYIYDEKGICGFRYLGHTYTYIKNIFNDVIKIYEEDNLICRYEYDAWGNFSLYNENGDYDSDSNSIGNINPIRYRSYYYDVETSLYYITSRYYDPEIGRFISPDSVDYLDPTTINGLNLYAYCGNDPINYYDPSGHIATELILGGTALCYLLAGLVILILGTGAVIASQTDFQNISFDVPFEWKASWNNLSANVSNMCSDISNWWNGLYEHNNASLSTTYANYNEFTIMEYQRRTPAPRIKCKSRKEAQQKAFLKGGKRKPILHFNGPHGPHFHPDDPKFSHWHYYFGWLLWKILNGEDDEYEY